MSWRALVVLFCLTLSLSIGLSDAAHAQIGPTCGAALETPGYGTCGNDLQHVFTNFVCKYQELVAQILGQVYCSVLEAMEVPLDLLLVLYVILFGSTILIGTTPASPKEMMMVVFKIGLLFAFTTEADFMISILYKGLVGFITQGVAIVMNTNALGTDANGAAYGGAGGGSANALFDDIDRMISSVINAITKDSSSTTAPTTYASPFGLLGTFALAAPPLFALGAAMAFKLVFVFFRTVIGYLIAMTLIMFLITLSPIFLGLGLFQGTRSYFHKWLEHLMSYALQIVIVFAFLAFVLSMGIEKDFTQLSQLSVNYNNTQWREGQRQDLVNVVSLPTGVNMTNDPATHQTNLTVTDPTPVPPNNMFMYPDVLQVIGTDMFELLLMALLVEAALKLAPQVAQQLGGASTLSVGGNSMNPGLDIRMAGAGAFQAGAEGLTGGIGRSGDMRTRVMSGLSGGWNGFVAGNPRAGQAGIFTDVARDFLGIRSDL